MYVSSFLLTLHFIPTTLSPPPPHVWEWQIYIWINIQLKCSPTAFKCTEISLFIKRRFDNCVHSEKVLLNWRRCQQPFTILGLEQPSFNPMQAGWFPCCITGKGFSPRVQADIREVGTASALPLLPQPSCSPATVQTQATCTPDEIALFSDLIALLKWFNLIVWHIMCVVAYCNLNLSHCTLVMAHCDVNYLVT